MDFHDDRLRRERPAEPRRGPQAGDESEAGGDTDGLREARDLAETARRRLADIESLLGTFSVTDLRNSGGQ